MKLLHTSDWHLGKRLEQFSRHEEQKQVLQEICEIADREQIDMIVVAGDLFDTINPPTESLELFYKTLKTLSQNGKRPIIAIAGNHDSPDRIDAPDPLAKACGIIFCGYPRYQIAPFTLDSGLSISKTDLGFIEIQINHLPPIRVLITPYANELRLKTYFQDDTVEMKDLLKTHWQSLADQYCDSNGINLLVTHLFMMKIGDPKPDEPEDEKPILHLGGTQIIETNLIPHQIQYTALGHLHHMQHSQLNQTITAYCGSPLAYTVNEAQKHVLIVELEPNQMAKLKKIPLKNGKPIFKKRFEDTKLALDWLNQNQDCYVELTIATDTFLTQESRRQLIQAHSGIIAIIPELKNEPQSSQSQYQVDLNQSMHELFIDYFRSEHQNQEPNQAILSLFDEVLAN